MLFLWMWEVNCLLIWISKQRNVDLDFYWSMIETKELYFKNSPPEMCEIASKHVLYCYISPYNIPGLKASKLCCQCVDLLCQHTLYKSRALALSMPNSLHCFSLFNINIILFFFSNTMENFTLF